MISVKFGLDQIILSVCIYGGARDERDIVIGNGYGKLSSNPG